MVDAVDANAENYSVIQNFPDFSDSSRNVSLKWIIIWSIGGLLLLLVIGLRMKLSLSCLILHGMRGIVFLILDIFNDF